MALITCLSATGLVWTRSPHHTPRSVSGPSGVLHEAQWADPALGSSQEALQSSLQLLPSSVPRKMFLWPLLDPFPFQQKLSYGWQLTCILAWTVATLADEGKHIQVTGRNNTGPSPQTIFLFLFTKADP